MGRGKRRETVSPRNSAGWGPTIKPGKTGMKRSGDLAVNGKGGVTQDLEKEGAQTLSKIREDIRTAPRG